nr:cytochrome c oxidase subunit 3, mitochondrial [Tanacetum cinerariifolium]
MAEAAGSSPSFQAKGSVPRLRLGQEGSELRKVQSLIYINRKPTESLPLRGSTAYGFVQYHAGRIPIKKAAQKEKTTWNSVGIHKDSVKDIAHYTATCRDRRYLAPKRDCGFRSSGNPFLNTLIPLSSGAAVTWAHHAILAGKEKRALYALVATVSLDLVFTAFQEMEYYQALSTISNSIYGSTFFLATGFHGFHVIMAAWYWHFVDVVRLLPFVSIYWWGDQLPLPRYGLDAPPAQAGLSDGNDQTIDYGENLCSSNNSAFRLSYGSSIFFGEANQASKSVLRLGIAPIGLAASGNLFCIIAFSSFQSLVHECDSLAGRSPTYRTIKKCLARVLNISLAVRSEPERISDRLEDPVSHAPLAFNSQGEHSEGKPALAFFTPTGISLGGSSEPLTLSPDHKPLGGCEPKERPDGMKLDQRERKHDQSDLVSEAGRE